MSYRALKREAAGKFITSKLREYLIAKKKKDQSRIRRIFRSTPTLTASEERYLVCVGSLAIADDNVAKRYLIKNKAWNGKFGVERETVRPTLFLAERAPERLFGILGGLSEDERAGLIEDISRSFGKIEGLHNDIDDWRARDTTDLWILNHLYFALLLPDRDENSHNEESRAGSTVGEEAENVPPEEDGLSSVDEEEAFREIIGDEESDSDDIMESDIENAYSDVPDEEPNNVLIGDHAEEDFHDVPDEEAFHELFGPRDRNNVEEDHTEDLMGSSANSDNEDDLSSVDEVEALNELMREDLDNRSVSDIEVINIPDNLVDEKVNVDREEVDGSLIEDMSEVDSNEVYGAILGREEEVIDEGLSSVASNEVHNNLMGVTGDAIVNEENVDPLVPEERYGLVGLEDDADVGVALEELEDAPVLPSIDNTLTEVPMAKRNWSRYLPEVHLRAPESRLYRSGRRYLADDLRIQPGDIEHNDV